MLQDLKLAIRGFAKSPAFAMTAALTLALGIGATTAIFTVANAELLRALPYQRPDRLVRIFERNWKLKIEQFSASLLNYLSWKERENGVPYTVVAIAPPGLEILSGPADIYAPLTVDRAKELRLNHTIFAMARLKAGVRINQPQAAMIDIARQVGAAYREVKDWRISLLGFDRWLISDQIRTALLVLLGAVGLVLLIVCANVANLLLSRAVSR